MQEPNPATDKAIWEEKPQNDFERTKQKRRLRMKERKKPKPTSFGFNLFAEMCFLILMKMWGPSGEETKSKFK